MRYAIVLYDGVEPIDIGATYGVLSMAKRRAPEIEYFGVATNGGPVTCANGLVVQADYAIADCPAADTVVVTGGPGWVAACDDARLLAFLKSRQGEAGTSMAAICTGAMILGKAGILDGHRATTKSEVYEGETAPTDLLAERPDVQVEAGPIVNSDGIVTSGGVTLGIDAMFYLLELDFGAELANDVARVMEYRRR